MPDEAHGDDSDDDDNKSRDMIAMRTMMVEKRRPSTMATKRMCMMIMLVSVARVRKKNAGGQGFGKKRSRWPRVRTKECSSGQGFGKAHQGSVWEVLGDLRVRKKGAQTHKGFENGGEAKKKVKTPKGSKKGCQNDRRVRAGISGPHV